MPRYKFACRSCKFECVSSIGKELGTYSSKVAMVCKNCSTIDEYTVALPGSINTEISKVPVCKHCSSSAHLTEWDGLTCPHCNRSMRALGADIDAEKPFKYW